MVDLKQVVNCGPFFAGDTGPPVEFIFTYDTGGYVDLTRSSVEVGIRRWDPRNLRGVGPSIATGPAVIADGLNGEAIFNWLYADPIATIPIDPGWYVLQATVILSSGIQQLSQKAIFEVISA